MAGIAVLFTVLLAATATSANHDKEKPQTPKKHFVGGDEGWRIGVNYDTWSNKEHFFVGDTLLFRHENGDDHGVYLVCEADYIACSTAKPIACFTGEDMSVSLDQPGLFFFIGPTPDLCSGGMKLVVNVLAASGPPASATPIPMISGYNSSSPPAPKVYNVPAVPTVGCSSRGDATSVLFHKLNYLIIGLSLVKVALMAL